MIISLDNGVLLALTADEATDLIGDIEDALSDPGEDIMSQLINEDGVTTFTVRVDA